MSEEEKIKNHILNVVFSGISWIFGYAGMWMLKWETGSFVLHTDLWSEAMDEVFFRVGANEGATINTCIDAITINWKHYSYSVFLIIGLLWLRKIFGTDIKMNGGGERTFVKLEEGVPLTTSFTPQNEHLISMSLNVRTESEYGHFLVTICDDEGNIIEKKKIEMDNVSDEAFTFETDWHLNTDEVYTFSIEAVGGDSESFIEIKKGDNYLKEFGTNVELGPEEYEGQPVSTLKYKILEKNSGKELFFKWISTIEAGAMVFIGISQFLILHYSKKKAKI